MPQTVPVLYEIEVNIARLLGASLTLLASTTLFVHQPLPPVSAPDLIEAVHSLEGQNRALILDGSLGEEVMLTMKRNADRILQIGVLGRVSQHIERSMELLADEERVAVTRLLGPAADAVFLLGTRLLGVLLETPRTQSVALDAFHWELMMVDGAFQAGRDELSQTRVLGSRGRRTARSLLWALQVARDAFLIVGSR